jgi:hypothetical protein
MSELPSNFRVQVRLVAIGVSAVGLAGIIAGDHIDRQPESQPRVDCNFQIIDPQVPKADKNWEAVERLLHVRPSQHEHVEWFPAACDTNLTDAELADGITQSPSVLKNKKLAAEFGNCALIGIQQQLIAEVGNKDQFAVLACVTAPDLVQI